MSQISFAIVLSLLLAIAFGTRKGIVYCLLPVIFAYPSRLWYGILPYNAGFDDMLIVFAFATMWLKGYRPQSKWVAKMLMWMFAIILVSELTSLGLTHMEVPAIVAKTVLKSVGLLLFGLTMTMTLETEQDVRRAVISLAIGVGLACLIALADHYKIGWARMFYVEVDLEHELLHTRAAGSFLSADGVGITVATIGWIGAAAVIYRSTIISKIAALPWCMLLIAALVASGSRSGMVGVAVVGVLILLFSPGRRLPVLLLFAIPVLIIVAIPEMRSAFQAMLDRTEEQSQAGSLWNSTGRLENISYSFRYAVGPWTLFCGAGETYYSLRGAYAHNGYVDLLMCYGLAGVIWAGLMISRLIRQAWFLRKNGMSLFSQNMGRAVLLGCVGTAACSMTIGPTMNTFWRYEFVWLAVCMATLVRVHCGQEKPLPLEPDEDHEGYFDGDFSAQPNYSRL